MGITVGTGQYVYNHHVDWTRRSDGQRLQRPSAVAVDSQDRAYVFQREGPPIVIFDTGGQLLDAWARRPGELEDAHHIYIGPDDRVYLTDRDYHQVLIFDLKGKLLKALGTRDKASLQAPFNHPADVAIAPSERCTLPMGTETLACTGSPLTAPTYPPSASREADRASSRSPTA